MENVLLYLFNTTKIKKVKFAGSFSKVGTVGEMAKRGKISVDS